MMKITNFKELRIWQKGIDLVEDIYTLTREFPHEEQYGLTSQMRRCAISIPSNIAEGFRRYHNKEYKQFLYIALGSAAELETQLIITRKLGYISNSSYEKTTNEIDHFSRMTNVLIQKL